MVRQLRNLSVLREYFSLPIPYFSDIRLADVRVSEFACSSLVSGACRRSEVTPSRDSGGAICRTRPEWNQTPGPAVLRDPPRCRIALITWEGARMCIPVRSFLPVWVIIERKQLW
jgi:hypothetical protein